MAKNDDLDWRQEIIAQTSATATEKSPGYQPSEAVAPPLPQPTPQPSPHAGIMGGAAPGGGGMVPSIQAQVQAPPTMPPLPGVTPFNFNPASALTSKPVYQQPSFGQTFLWGNNATNKAKAEYDADMEEWTNKTRLALTQGMSKDNVDDLAKRREAALAVGDNDLASQINTDMQTKIKSINLVESTIDDAIKANGVKTQMWQQNQAMLSRMAGKQPGQKLTPEEYDLAINRIANTPELLATVLRNSVMMTKPENMTNDEYTRITGEGGVGHAIEGWLSYVRRTNQESSSRALQNLLMATEDAYSGVQQKMRDRIQNAYGAHKARGGKSFQRQPIQGLDQQSVIPRQGQHYQSPQFSPEWHKYNVGAEWVPEMGDTLSQVERASASVIGRENVDLIDKYTNPRTYMDIGREAAAGPQGEEGESWTDWFKGKYRSLLEQTEGAERRW